VNVCCLAFLFFVSLFSMLYMQIVRLFSVNYMKGEVGVYVEIMVPIFVCLFTNAVSMVSG
jgi:hypothetical protein